MGKKKNQRAKREQQAALTTEHLMNKAMPHLQRLSVIFGRGTKLTLLVQAEGLPGCLIVSPQMPTHEELCKAIMESKKIEEEMAKVQESGFVPTVVEGGADA